MLNDWQTSLLLQGECDCAWSSCTISVRDDHTIKRIFQQFIKMICKERNVQLVGLTFPMLTQLLFVSTVLYEDAHIYAIRIAFKILLKGAKIFLKGIFSWCCKHVILLWELRCIASNSFYAQRYSSCCRCCGLQCYQHCSEFEVAERLHQSPLPHSFCVPK